MKKVTIYIDDNELQKIVKDELRELLEILENENPTHKKDIAYIKKMIPVPKVVINYYKNSQDD